MTLATPNRPNEADRDPIENILVWKKRILEYALTLASLLLFLVLATLLVQGDPAGLTLAVRLTPGFLIVLVALVWKSASVNLRGYAMVVGYTMGIIVAGLERGYTIPNPWVATTFVTVMSALVFDRVRAWVIFGLLTVLWIGMSVHWIRGQPPLQDSFSDPSIPANWVRIMFIFLMFSAGSVASIQFLIRHLERALNRAESLNHALHKESQQRIEILKEQHTMQQQLITAQKIESMGRMAGGIAHDFNNMLQIVQANAELLSKSNFADQERPTIDDLQNAIRQASSLTQQLLSLKPAQTNKLHVIDLGQSTKQAIRLAESILPPEITIHAEYPKEPIFTKASQTAVEQILTNLIFNSRDAMPEGGTIWVRVHTETGTDDDPGTSSQSTCVVEVQDEGHGMSPEVQSNIFEPFFTTKPVGQGTGLGLSLIRTLLTDSNGSIEVESLVGEGTKFTVRMLNVTPTKTDEVGTPNLQAPTLPGNHILIVDDEHHVRRLTARILSLHGLSSVTAASGPEAIEIYSNSSRPFDVVISDARMPDMSGRDLYNHLVKIDPDLRFLVCSGFTGTYFQSSFFDHPRRRFLAKPFRSEQLLEVLNELLGKP